MNTIRIEKENRIGKIKPMHCGNNVAGLGGDCNGLYKDLKIPYTRLHDSASIERHLVDTTSVFPNFDADENDPLSYDFAFTDFYLQNIIKTGMKPYYRLGVTIENYAYIKAYNIHPPKDFKKWARICEHIIMHYNEGWNNGYSYGIEYWEIWNEPENSRDPARNQMWTGTFEELIELYEVTANHLKNRFPGIKVGGYGSCGFYSILNETAGDAACVTEETDYFIECANKFLKTISSSEHKAPLDFFSWHSYGTCEKNVKFARYVRKLLDDYGFKKTESHLNEWNPSMWIKGTLIDSSNILANMLALQNEPLDMAMYYQFRMGTDYNSLIDPLKKKPMKGYYAFKAFSYLYEKKEQVKVTSYGDGGIYYAGAYDGNEGVLVITNNSNTVNWTVLEGIEVKEVKLLTERNDDNLDTMKGGNKTQFDLFPFESAVIIFN